MTDEQAQEPCEHGRRDYRICPHCMGIGSAPQKPYGSAGNPQVDLSRSVQKPADLWDCEGHQMPKGMGCRICDEYDKRQKPDVTDAASKHYKPDAPDVIYHTTGPLVAKSAYDALANELAETLKWKEIFMNEVEGETALNERWQGYNKDLQDKLASAQARIAELETALVGRTYSHSDIAVEKELATAQARVAELEAEEIKYLRKLEQVVLEYSEREQKLVAALEKAKDLFFEMQWDGLGKAKHERVYKIRELLFEALKAHKGGACSDCQHPGCCCVCGHSGICPDCGPSIIEGVED